MEVHYKKISSFTFKSAILCLIWTVHYYAKRYTGGLVDEQDNIVCGIVCFVRIVVILVKIVGICKDKKRVKALHGNRQDAMQHYHHKDNKGRRNQPKKNN